MATVASRNFSSPRSNLRALGAVAWREWTIFRRYPSWIVSMFVWPIIMPAAYIFGARALSGPSASGLGPFAEATGTSDYIGYIAIGTIVWMWQNMALWSIGFALRDDQIRGTLESNWLSPAPRLWYLLGSALMNGVLLLSFLIISGLEFALFFGAHFNGNPLLVGLVLLLAMPSIYGLGFAFASLVMAAREANAFVFLVRGLVMIFCGITFPISVLPGWMHAISAWLPPTYVIHGVRSALLDGASLPSLLPDLAALVGFGVFWLVVGYLLFNRMDRRSRQTGSLSQY